MFLYQSLSKLFIFFLLWNQINPLDSQTSTKSNLKLGKKDFDSYHNESWNNDERTWIFKHNPDEDQMKRHLGSKGRRRDSIGRVLLNLNEPMKFEMEATKIISFRRDNLDGEEEDFRPVNMISEIIESKGNSRIILAIENSEQIIDDELEACFPDQIDEEQQVLRSPGFDEANEIDESFIVETPEGNAENEENGENNFESIEIEFEEPHRFSIENRVYCDAVVSCHWNILPRVGRKCLCQQYYVCH